MVLNSAEFTYRPKQAWMMVSGNSSVEVDARPAGALDETTCILIDQEIYNTQQAIQGVGSTFTFAETIDVFDKARTTWSDQALTVANASATKWLNSLSDDANLIRVKLSQGDSDGAIAPLKNLAQNFLLNSSYCP